MNEEEKAKAIVEEWAEFKGGSFSGSDLWSLIKAIAEALKEAKLTATSI